MIHVKAIVQVLLRTYLLFPQGNELCDVEGFKTKWGMIQCARAIVGSHVLQGATELRIIMARHICHGRQKESEKLKVTAMGQAIHCYIDEVVYN